MTDTTARLGLPMLDAGQAQKEATHNEALVAIDIAVQASVIAIGLATPPAAPVEGQAWVVGETPSAEWAGHARAIAGWTAGGWRFVAPFDGMAVWSVADMLVARFRSGTWVTGTVTARRLEIGGLPVVGGRRPPIAMGTGGGTIDAESRIAIGAILDALRSHGLIAP